MDVKQSRGETEQEELLVHCFLLHSFFENLGRNECHDVTISQCTPCALARSFSVFFVEKKWKVVAKKINHDENLVLLLLLAKDNLLASGCSSRYIFLRGSALYKNYIMSFAGFYRPPKGHQQQPELSLGGANRMMKRSYMLLEGPVVEPRTRPRRLYLTLVMMVIYFTGILWHCLHPVVSVFTGDFNGPRKIYVDESNLQPANLRVQKNYGVPLLPSIDPSEIFSMCDAVATNHMIHVNECYVHSNQVEIATIIPSATAVAPVMEAVVLVLPATSSWRGSVLHVVLTTLIERLSSPQDSPWLAKTLILATPVHHSDGYTLSPEETVEYVLRHSMDKPDLNATSNLKPITSAIIRNLIVVDIAESKDQSSTDNAELRILTQGPRGVLPNMDLYSAVYRAYSMYSSFVRSDMVSVHPYRQQVNDWQKYFSVVSVHLPPEIRRWIRQFLDLVAFEYSLAFGPTQPHGPALLRGIDALTVQLVLDQPNAADKRIADYVQSLEIVVHALSNLHERLHHSTSLYLLPSPASFVKHEEYLVPCILMLLPCVIRAFALILFDIDSFDWATTKTAISTVGFSVAASSWFVPKIDGILSRWGMVADPLVALQIAICLSYIPVLIMPWASSSLSRPLEYVNAKASLQCILCLLCVYINISVAFGHVSLAVPSALLWSPLVAFPSFTSRKSEDHRRERLRRSFALGMLAVLPVFHCWVLTVFGRNTAYLQYGYLPLSFLLCLLWGLEL